MTLAITGVTPIRQAVALRTLPAFPGVIITDPGQTVTVTITELTEDPGLDYLIHFGVVDDALATLLTLTDPNAATDGSVTTQFTLTLSGDPAAVTQDLD